MTLHIVQHVPFEGPGRISGWAQARGVSMDIIPIYTGAALPEPRPE